MTYEKIIVDGNLLAYRAFFGNSELAYNGEGTGMPYGFLQSLLTVRDLFSTGKFFVCFDKGHDARTQIFADYKAHRTLEEDVRAKLHRQMKVTQRLLRNLGVMQVHKEGCEADDVIATLCQKFAHQKKLIVSNDKDLMQLLDDKTFILKSVKQEYQVLSVKKFEKQYGFAPDFFVFHLALTGDKGDNVPGVPGIGEKRATEIVQENMRLLEEFLNEADVTLNGKQAQKVHAHADAARLAFKLVKLMTLDKLTFERGELHADVVKKIFAQLGFVEFRKSTVFKNIMQLGE